MEYLVGTTNGGTVATARITVATSSMPPQADSLNVRANEDQPVNLTLIGRDPANDPLTYTIIRASAHGTVSGSGTSRLYTPDANWYGTDTFTYRVTDHLGNASDDATATIVVDPVNDAPALVIPSPLTTPQDESLTFRIDATDIDDATGSLTFALEGTPQNGTVRRSGADWTFTPAPGFAGDGRFNVRVTDPSGGTAIGSILIRVTDPSAIRAQSLSLSTDEDVALPLTLAATDPLGRSLTFSLVTPPSTGTLVGISPSLSFVPEAEWSGSTSFRFRACAQAECSDPATVTLVVRPVNDPPVADAKTVSTDEEVAVTVTLTGRDAEGAAISFELSTPPTRGTAQITGNSLRYAPSTDAYGTDQLFVVAFDGQSRSTPAAVSISVRNVNDPPLATSRTLRLPMYAESGLTLAATDSDDDARLLTYEVVSNPLHGTLQGLPPTLTYRPEPGFSGPDALTFAAIDPHGARSPTATITLEVAGTGLPPVATSQRISGDEDAPLEIVLSGVDPENAPLTFELVDSPAFGLVSGPPPNVRYVPRSNVNGEDSFTFRVSDGQGWSAPATVTITIRPVNDAPVIRAPGLLSVGEDAPQTFDVTVTDVDSALVTVNLDSTPAHGALTRATGGGNRFTYTPQPNFSGFDAFGLRANDGSALSEAFTVSVQVVPADDPPTARAQSLTTLEDVPIDLVLTGADLDNDTLSFRVDQPPLKGALSGTPPNLRYTPTRDANGRDTFTFTVSDGLSRSPPATVAIDVTPVNDAPVLSARTLVTPEDTPLLLSVAAGTVSVTDAENDPLTFIFATPSEGTLEAINAATHRWLPPADFNGRATVSVVARDRVASSSPVTLTIDVTPVNDPPAFTVPLPASRRDVEDGTAISFTLAARDPDTADSLRFSASALPSGAQLGAVDGRFNWTPAYEQLGPHEVVFRVTDRAGTYAEYAVTFVVATADGDRDGVPDALERRFFTDPTKPDTDGDGLDDLTELGSLLTPLDTDRDTTLDALDRDSDNDGIPDADEHGENGTLLDTDLDGLPDQRDPDADADSHHDDTDNCRIVANAGQEDLDQDGRGDACDPDVDGDGVSDSREIALGSDPRRADSDGDSVLDGDELGLDAYDTDRDGTIDARELDSDDDGVSDADEAGDDDPRTPPVDSDADGSPDLRDLDSDNDGVPDATDRCRLVTDPEGGDLDGDGQGDACDGDEDGDGVPDRSDTCPRIADPEQSDADGDRTGDACESDDDGDGHDDTADNCPGVPNPDQLDFDRDGLGEACDDAFDAVPVGGCSSPGPACLALLSTWVWSRRRRARSA